MLSVFVFAAKRMIKVATALISFALENYFCASIVRAESLVNIRLFYLG